MTCRTSISTVDQDGEIQIAVPILKQVHHGQNLEFLLRRLRESMIRCRIYL
jgi:hypothetical protein